MIEHDRLEAQFKEIEARNRLEDTLAERAACAELVRAAGCLCWEIYAQRYPKDLADYISPDDGAPHYDECPEALAAAIEERK